MTNHIFNAVVNDFVRHRNRLFRVTGIVIFYDLQFVAFNAAFSVDIRNRLLCAGKLLVTVLRNRTGHCAHDRDFNIFCQSHIAECQRDTSCQ
ncbi:Uncharacterised protein [Shigella sonnei]|nr:Uncharacterised protein [Shigella sonnei]